MYTLNVDNIGKRFGTRKVFSKINFSLQTGDSIAVVGANGSGKSTLLKVMLSILAPTKGTVVYKNEDTILDDDNFRSYLSFVAPYLNLYDHLTAEENLTFFSTVAGFHITGKKINSLLEQVGLEGRGMDFVVEYSSGMKQRLKYAVALLKKPEFLFIDEPTSNLDEDGKKIVSEIIEELRKDSIIIIATNEKEEYDLAKNIIRLV